MLHVITVDKNSLLCANQAVHADPTAVLFYGMDAPWCKTFLFSRKLKPLWRGLSIVIGLSSNSM
jgi:hypothetical protein